MAQLERRQAASCFAIRRRYKLQHLWLQYLSAATADAFTQDVIARKYWESMFE